VPTLASDAERERCAQALRDHAAAGRLEIAELEERLAIAYGARYRSQLRLALRNLPRDHGRRVAGVAARVDRLVLRLHAWSYATVNGSAVALWAASGQGDFWPALTIGPWGVVLAWHAGGSWSLRRMLRRRAAGELAPPGRRGRLTA
jgi:hypothetical protein